MFLFKTLNERLRNRYVVSNWAKKKFVWRYNLFFTVVFLLLVVGLIFTTTVRMLIESASFNNEMCSSSTIASVKRNFMTMIIFVTIISCINFIFSRLTNLYSNYTNGEFFNLGIYCTIVGFLIKYISWFLSLIYMCWSLFIIINAITIFFNPNSWCHLRYNVYGNDAVENCQLARNGNAGCEIENSLLTIKSSESCNDFKVLTMYSFLYFVRKSPTYTCSLKNKQLCEFFITVLKTKEVKWNAFPECAGDTVDLQLQHFLEDSKQKSDFYLLSVAYNLFWGITAVVLFSCFILIKLKTPVDSSFILDDEKLNMFFKFTRLMDIWR